MTHEYFTISQLAETHGVIVQSW